MTAYLLNLAYLFFTLHAFSNGSVELNPLMACVPVQIVYKIIVAGLLIAWLERRNEKTAITLVTVVYAAVNVWHIWNIAAAWAA